MNNVITKIVSLFIFWRVLLIISFFIGLSFMPLNNQDKFLGGGPKNYQLSPEFFSWANFDGEHYLSISIFGYKEREQVFFPLYPLLISISKIFANDLSSSLVYGVVAGLIISHASFLLALFYLYKLITLDYSKKVAFWTLVILILFPTSFYFGAVYNESLFLLLSVLSFLNARKGNWLYAAFFGFLASATRVFGIVLLPALLYEAWQQKAGYGKYFYLSLIPLGLVFYMIYQYFTVFDPLAFYNLQKYVGEQRSSGFVLLPQVIFRYLKMIITVDKFAPIYQTIILEFVVGITFFLLPIYGYFKKIRISYLIYVFISFLITTIQGSFSSVPRYVLVFFPSFIAASLLIERWQAVGKLILVIIMAFMLIWECGLFLRGYWVA